MRLSLRRKIFLFFLLPAAGIYLSTVMFNIFKMRQMATTDIERRMTELAGSYADRFDSRLREVALIATMTAAYIENNPRLTSSQIYALLEANLERNHLVYGSAVAFEPYRYEAETRLFVRYVHRDGAALRRLDPTPAGYDYTEEKQEYWHTPRDTGKAVWTEPYFDDGAGDILMATYSVPFFQNGDFLGIATVDIPLEPLRKLADVGVSEDISITIITNAGKYVYSPFHERINESVFEIGRRDNSEDLLELARAITSGATGVRKLTGWTSDEREWIFHAPIKSAQWGFAAGIPEGRALATVRERFYRDLTLLLASFVLVVIGLWFLSAQISRPIMRLSASVIELGKGNLEVRVPAGGNDEVGALGAAFNEMVLRLSEREAALKENEERYRLHFENVGDVIYATDRSFRITDISPSIEALLGYRPDELIGRRIDEANVIPPEYFELALSNSAKALGGEQIGPTEYEFIAKDGTRKIGEVIDTPLFKDEEVIAIISVARDITDRKQAESALRNERSLFEEYINSLPGLFYVFDERLFVRWNREWEIVTGYTADELAAMYATDFFDGEDGTRVGEQMLKVFREGSAEVEAELVTKDGRRIPYHFTGARKKFGGKDHLVGLGVDITERKRTEEERRKLESQLQHAQKLESLGVLAGGIAHDFNNLLTSILGNADLALLNLSKVSPARDNLGEIMKASTRAAELCNQMLAYSGKGKFIVEPINLNELVEEMAHLLQISISKKAVLRFNFADNLPAVNADATQMRQIIMNLITNASEAIGEKSGVISISTGAMECDKAYLAQTYLDEELPDGVYVTLEVSDTGAGMDQATLDSMFEPFFTTKFTGRGLGLAAALGIVRGHGGAIKVYSELRKGTTFKVLLPALDMPAKQRREEGTTSEGWRGSGAVLLVDDEESVRTIGKMMLEEMGFDVLPAPDGREAVAIFEKSPDEIAFVLLDMTMPHMGGEETFREIRRIKKDAKVILSSGYNEQEVTSRFAGKGLAGFVQKPYKYETLRKIIRATGESPLT